MFCLLYKPGWLGTYYVDQVGLELSEICLSLSKLLELKVWVRYNA